MKATLLFVIMSNMPGMLKWVQETGLLVFFAWWYTCAKLDGVEYLALRSFLCPKTHFIAPRLFIT